LSLQPFIQGRCKEEGKSSQGVIVMRTTSALLVGVHDPAYANGASFGKVNTDIGRLAYVGEGLLCLMCLYSSAPHIFCRTAPASCFVLARRRCGSDVPI